MRRARCTRRPWSRSAETSNSTERPLRTARIRTARLVEAAAGALRQVTRDSFQRLETGDRIPPLREPSATYSRSFAPFTLRLPMPETANFTTKLSRGLAPARSRRDRPSLRPRVAAADRRIRDRGEREHARVSRPRPGQPLRRSRAVREEPGPERCRDPAGGRDRRRRGDGRRSRVRGLRRGRRRGRGRRGVAVGVAVGEGVAVGVAVGVGRRRCGRRRGCRRRRRGRRRRRRRRRGRRGRPSASGSASPSASARSGSGSGWRTSPRPRRHPAPRRRDGALPSMSLAG